jgi:hypothetical protein
MAVNLRAHVKEGVIHTLESSVAGYVAGCITPLGPAVGLAFGVIDGLVKSVVDPFFQHMRHNVNLNNVANARFIQDVTFYGAEAVSMVILFGLIALTIGFTSEALFVCVVGVPIMTHVAVVDLNMFVLAIFQRV